MSLTNQFWLGIAAILTTAAVSSFVIAVGAMALGASGMLLGYSLSEIPWKGLTELGTVIFVAGSLSALLPAALMGFLEWPQSRRLAKQPSGGFLAHVGISVLGSQILAAPLVLLLNALDGSSPTVVGIVWMMPIFAFGGLCSALAWHFIFVRKLRKYNVHSAGPSPASINKTLDQVNA